MIIEPLVGMVAELLRRQNELQSLLIKKDMEISDYRQSEVQLSRSMYNSLDKCRLFDITGHTNQNEVDVLAPSTNNFVFSVDRELRDKEI